MLSNKKNISFDNLFIIFGIIILVPFLFISIYNNPSADDYCGAVIAKNYGYWGAQKFWYQNWTGRYFATIVGSLSPWMINNLIIYKTFPIVLIFILFYSINCLFRNIFENINWKNSIIFSFIIMIVYLLQMPSISEGFFWMSGVVCYQISNILTILLLIFIIKLIKSNKIKYLIISIILVFAIVGSNETSMLVLNVFLWMLFGIIFLEKKKPNYLLLVLIFFTLIFSLIAFVSPGNDIRSNKIINESSIVFAGSRTIYWGIKYLIKWIPLLIILSLVFYDNFKTSLTSGSNRLFNIHPLIALVLTAPIAILGFFPSLWVSRSLPPPRAINVCYFYFILCFLYLNFVIINYITNKNKVVFAITPWIKYALAFLFIISLLLENNITTAYSDILSGEAKRYDMQLKERIEIIKNSNDTCIVPVLSFHPKTIFFDDITNNPTDWRNDCHDKYWQKIVILK